MTAAEESGAAIARALMRGATTAALGTSLAPVGWPMASLVLVACDHDGAPIVLLSDLAEHSRNLAADPRMSLLFTDPAAFEDALGGGRVTVLGRAARTSHERHRRRYLARHPSARDYAGFADFAFYRVAVERAHLVAGFGRIEWIGGAELLLDAAAAGDLVEREAAIVRHMNADHADAVRLYAEVLLGLGGGDWVMTGCDAEGIDLRRGATVARLGFDAPVLDGAGARAHLVALANRAQAAKP